MDLGASPGGWSQVAAPAVGPRGLVVAVDLLPMIPLPGVHFILGDCREDAIIEAVAASLGARAADLVLSDMAPNLSGIRSADEARSLELVAVAFEACQRFLKPGGTLLVKAFQHEETERFLRGQRNAFEKIARRKPAASRRESREFYVVAAGFKG